METLECIAGRRSCRRFLPQAVPRELLDQVIEAGRQAPSGGNNQSWHFLVVTDERVLADLAQLVEQEFSALETAPGMYPSLVHSIERAKKGGYVFHYHAPVLVLVANRKGYGNAMADSACALQNMMLAAHALGLGSCWINQLHWLAEESGMTGAHPAADAYLHSLGLGEDAYICGSVAIGYPDMTLPALTPRKSKVTYI